MSADEHLIDHILESHRAWLEARFTSMTDEVRDLKKEVREGFAQLDTRTRTLEINHGRQSTAAEAISRRVSQLGDRSHTLANQMQAFASKPQEVGASIQIKQALWLVFSTATLMSVLITLILRLTGTIK